MGEVTCNPAYKPVAHAAQPLQILFGGSSSGKSRFIAQRTILDLVQGKRNYLIVRKIARSLRDSVWKELLQVIDSAGLISKFRLNKTEMTATCTANGMQAACFGLDNTEKIKSVVPEKGVFTDVWIEEATEISQDDLRQLVRRMRGKAGVPKRVTMSFNPIFRDHWICKEYFTGWADLDTFHKSKDLLILKTTYKDNKFLDDFEIRTLEDESDPYWYDVYTLGNWGLLGDLIFKNWSIADVKNDPVHDTFDRFFNGLDFGYSFDPNAFIRLYYHHALKRIYITDEWASTGCTNPEIAASIKPLLDGDYVVCDSAEPKSIKELSLNQINAIGAVKGPDSIRHGIQWLQQQQIIVDKGCINTIRNLQTYHWQKDKQGQPKYVGGNPVPADRDNDFIDALRYALEDQMFSDSQFEITTTKSQAIM